MPKPAGRALTTIELSCPLCEGDAFELRVLGDEGLAAAHCVGCTGDFLPLDSEDYWFDAIQATYPRHRRCACKATAFRLKCEYFYRSDCDVKSVSLWSVCAACGKTRRQMGIEVDYSDTDDLVKRPLRFCKTPNLRYDLKDISLFVTASDMTSVIDYLNVALRCTFVCRQREKNSWIEHVLHADEVQQAILSGQYCHLYASLSQLDLSELQHATSRQEQSYWRRHEVIRISSPTRMRMGREEGLLYYIHYSNDSVEDDIVVKKREIFRVATESLLQWLDAKFVSWRGRNCFDNASEHFRLFGNRFAKNRKSDRRHPPLGEL